MTEKSRGPSRYRSESERHSAESHFLDRDFWPESFRHTQFDHECGVPPDLSFIAAATVKLNFRPRTRGMHERLPLQKTEVLSMAIKSDDVVRLAIGLMWPVVVLILAVLFRRGLRDFLQGAAGLIRGGLSKVSLPGGFAFELVKTNEVKIDWSGPGGEDLRNSVAIGQFASGVQDILGLLKPPQPSQTADYAVFDLGSGDKWLTSRLHLFSLLLRRTHGLRYCVFVYDSPEVLGRSLGFATTEVVRWSLALKYPHLEQAAHRAALLSDRVTSRTGALDPQIATAFINNYLQSIQINLLLSIADFANDVTGFAKNLLEGSGSLSGFLRSQLPEAALNELKSGPKWTYQLTGVADALNAVIDSQSLYQEARFAGIQLSEETKRLVNRKPDGDERILLNRLLLHEAYPLFVAPVLPPTITSFNIKDWVKLRNRDTSGIVRTTLEYARWLDRASVEKLVGPDLGRAQVEMVSLQAASRKDQVLMILRAEGPMVALVGEGGRFQRLVDRLALAARAIEFYL
jgi:hypothetical protein